MNSQWATKEKIVLLSDILEFGDQPESWSTIANDLLRTFQTSPLSSTTVATTTVAKKEGRYSIQVRPFYVRSFLSPSRSLLRFI